jgi:hypothetical protein
MLSLTGQRASTSRRSCSSCSGVASEWTLDPAKFAGKNRDVRAGYGAVNVTIKVASTSVPRMSRPCSLPRKNVL